jgi:uncharacterized protein
MLLFLATLTRIALAPFTLLLALFLSTGTAGAWQDSERELTFVSGDVSLAGTLVLPQGSGPFPGVVILHGSGPDSRQPYRPDADMLARGGIATLIYDKRGTGESSGDWRTATLDDLVADGLAAVRLLRQQPEIAAGQVGILGSSQGAWLAPFAAGRDPEVSFVVQVTGSATPLAHQEMWDDGNSLAALGFSERAIKTAMKAQHLLYSARPLIQRGILPLGDLWFVHYDPYLDPAEAWARVRVPALVLYGGLDPTVPSRSSLEVVEWSLAAQGHPTSRIAVFPQAGHGLGGASRNQNPAYSTLVTGWIQAVARNEPYPETDGSVEDIPDGPLRWYGIGGQPTPWHGTAPVQLGLILGFVLTSLLAVLLSLIPGTHLPVLFRLPLGLAGAVNLFLIGGLLLVINYLLNADASSASNSVPLGGILPILSTLSLVLALTLAYAAFRAWQARAWSGFVRALYTLAVLAALGMVPFLAYWNLLGGPL